MTKKEGQIISLNLKSGTQTEKFLSCLTALSTDLSRRWRGVRAVEGKCPENFEAKAPLLIHYLPNRGLDPKVT